MNSSADIPVYNLKAVVHETGLKPDTIRAWERRYGLPEPKRTESGHRLYSQNDITMLKWLIARQNEGMSISRAVVLWQRIQADQLDPNDLAAGKVGPALLVQGEELSAPSGSDMLSQMRAAWLKACLHFDEQAAEQILAEAFTLFPVETVCLELIQRGLALIGEDWHQGRVTVQQEHFASALAMRRIETLLTATPAPTRPSRILIGCPPEEAHILAPMLLALLLRRRGWDVIFLGADIPLADLTTTTRATGPQLVILVAQHLLTAATLLEMGQLLLSERLLLAFGGRIFAHTPDLRRRIPGHYLGDQLDAAPPQVEELLATPHLQPAFIRISYDYQAALRGFKAHLAQIKAEVWQHVAVFAETANLDYADVERAIEGTSRHLIAALMLGNLDFMQPEIEWIRQLLSYHYAVPAGAVAAFLRVYASAVEHYAEGTNGLIHTWLYKVADSQQDH
jgi:MerR family transcriptional regulator, light-induced transcriptional regulator